MQLDEITIQSFHKGDQLRNEKKFEKAIIIYTKILEKYPELLPAYNNIGLSYAEQNNFDMAEKNFLICLRLEPNNLAPINNLAKLYFKNKKHKKAIPFYQKSLTLKSDQPLIAELYAESLLDLNLISETNHFCEQAIKRYPDNKIIQYCYGKNLLKLNKHEKGLSIIKKATGIIEFKENSFEIR